MRGACIPFENGYLSRSGVGTLQDLTGLVFEYEPGAESVIPTNSGKELVEVSIGWRFQRLDERGVEISEGSGRAEEEPFRRFTKRRMALEMVPGVWLQGATFATCQCTRPAALRRRLMPPPGGLERPFINTTSTPVIA